jgi:hypothetical protein
LQDKLNQVDLAGRTAEDRKQGLEAAAKAGDFERTKHQFTVITVLKDRAIALTTEGDQCVGGDPSLLDRSTSVTRETPFLLGAAPGAAHAFSDRTTTLSARLNLVWDVAHLAFGAVRFGGIAEYNVVTLEPRRLSVLVGGIRGEGEFGADRDTPFCYVLRRAYMELGFGHGWGMGFDNSGQLVRRRGPAAVLRVALNLLTLEFSATAIELDVCFQTIPVPDSGMASGRGSACASLGVRMAL